MTEKSYIETTNERAKAEREPVGRLPIIAVDFDGCIHSYEHGWRNGGIYGTVVPGFWEWAEQTKEYFTLVVYSSRSATQDGIDGMKAWMAREHPGKQLPNYFKFADKKPPAWVTIDDRGLTFRGDWSEFSIHKLKNFQPWMVQAALEKARADEDKPRSDRSDIGGGPEDLTQG